MYTKKIQTSSLKLVTYDLFVFLFSLIMPIDKIHYERSHVIIKERSSQSQTQDTPLDEVTGTITIIENERGKFFRFVPLGLEDVMTDDWAMINGGHSVVCQKNDTGNFFLFLINK